MEKKKKTPLTATKEKPSARSETVSVRLGPQMRYFAELAARKQRRSLSNFIEWAIERSFDHVVLGLDFSDVNKKDSVKITVTDEIYNHTLWSYDKTTRFALLAIHYPELLNHKEQALWEIANKANLLEKGKNKNGTLNKELVEKKCLSRISQILPFLEDVYFNKPEKLDLWIAKVKDWMLEDHPETEFFSCVIRKG